MQTAVAVDQRGGYAERIGMLRTQRFNNHVTGIGFIITADFIIAERAGTGDRPIKIVGRG